MRASSIPVIVAVLVLAACERSAGPPPGDPATAPTTVPAASKAGWRLEDSAASGVVLMNMDESGETLLRLACRRTPPGSLYAELPGFARIDSEDRLTIGAGGELAVLVVSMEGSAVGLRAEGQPQPKFVAAVAEGRPLAVSYGSRQISLGAPAQQDRSTFAAACGEQTAS